MDNQNVKPKLTRLLQPGEVRVFDKENYEGEVLQITGDTAQLDVNAASILIGPQTGVTLFSESEYKGISQDLTCDLPKISESRLQVIAPKSMKIWTIESKPFRGYWAIEVEKGKYLSVQSDANKIGILATRTMVSVWEAFQIKENGEAIGGHVAASISVLGEPLTKSTAPQQFLTIDKLQNVTLFDEPDEGFRKFSLALGDDQWICYQPAQDRFVTTADEDKRTIFCKSVKIAEDESQVGMLMQGEVALYENPGYWGKAWVFHTDYANFESFVGLNDEVSSIQLAPLTGATIYRGAEYKGESVEGKQDIIFNLSSLKQEQVGEDQISSIRIWRIVRPEELGVTFSSCLSQDYRTNSGDLEEYSAYRTTIRLPSIIKSVDLWATDEIHIEVNGTPQTLSEDQPINVTPNLIGCLVISSDAIIKSSDGQSRGTLRTPGLKIRTDTMQPQERIVIFPDQEVHERLANLQEDELWNATYTDQSGVPQRVFKDTSPQKKDDVANAQNMISKVMSTVKYSEDTRGTWNQTISPDILQGKAWALDFLTYRVTADTLYVRKGPGINYKAIGVLRKNETVEVIEFSEDAKWIHIRRISDGLTGWSSSTYLDRISEIPTEGEQYRVTAKGLHVREGPGVEFQSLGYIQYDEIVHAIGINDKGTWRKIVQGDGLIGWSSARYLSLVQGPPQRFALGIAPVEELATVPGIPALSPQARFHEVSQAEVQTMLAQPRSPDADLAQRFFDDFAKAIQGGVSFVVHQVQQGVALIIQVGKEIVNWIVDTAEKVVAFVEGIFERIGAAVEEVVKWLRYVFDWKDITDVQKYLSKQIIECLDYLGDTFVKGLEKKIGQMFEVANNSIEEQFDKMITQLGGIPAEGPQTESSLTRNLLGVLDKAQWLLNKILETGGQGFEFAMDAAGFNSIFQFTNLKGVDQLDTVWDDAFNKTLNSALEIPTGVERFVTAMVQNPDKPWIALSELLKLFKELTVGLVGAGETFVLGVIRLMGNLIDIVKSILTTKITIPFLSDLLKQMGVPEFSLLDVISILLAVPITVVSKAILHRMPFDFSKSVLGKTYAQEIDGWEITGSIANFVGGTLKTIQDVIPEGRLEDFSLALDVFGWGCSLTGWISALPEVPENWEEPASWQKASDFVLFGYESVALTKDLVLLARSLNNRRKKIKATDLEQNRLVLVSTGCGVLHAILIVVNNLDKFDEVEGYSQVSSTIPEILTFLKFYPHLVWILVLFDGVMAVKAITLDLILANQE